MKKYEYKLASYSFNARKLLVSDVLKIFNNEGANGWELVQWESFKKRLNILNTESVIYIDATWKREVSHNNIKE